MINEDYSWDDWLTPEEKNDDFLEGVEQKDPTTEVAQENPEKDLDKQEPDSDNPGEEEPNPDPGTDPDTPGEEEEEKEEKEEEEEEEEEEEVEVKVPNELLEGLKAQGLFTTDSDDVEDILENIEETLLETVEAEVNSVFEELSSDLGEDGKQFLQYMKSGGKAEDFFKTYTEDNISLFDINSEAGQENFLRWYYANVEKADAEEISDKIEYLQSSDKVEKTATRLFEKATLQRKKKREAVIKAQQAKITQQKATEKERKTKLRQSLLEVREVAGFKISPSERRAIYADLTEPTEKVGNRYVPKFVAEITRFQQEDPAKLALMMKLIRSDFDFTPLLKKAETQVSKKVKRVIQAETEPTLKKQKQTSKETKPVWRYFN